MAGLRARGSEGKGVVLWGSGCTMATASAQLLATSFVGHMAGFTTAGRPAQAVDRSVCTVTCASPLGSTVRDSLKIAVILPIACTVLTASPLQGFGFHPFYFLLSVFFNVSVI